MILRRQCLEELSLFVTLEFADPLLRFFQSVHFPGYRAHPLPPNVTRAQQDLAQRLLLQSD